MYNSYAINKAQAFGYLSVWEVMALQLSANLLPKDKHPIIVNFGAGSGTSGLAFAEARPDAVIYTIDISEGGPEGGLMNEINAFNETDLKLPTQMLGSSSDAGERWGRGLVDYVFVDGAHDEEQVRKDIVAWKKNLITGGIMAMHDYTSPNWPDVKVVADELLAGWDVIMQVDTVKVFRKVENES